MSMRKVYVIQETSFEYNDEVYHTGYSRANAGSPITAYASKAKADRECARLNIAKVRKENLSYYGYGWGEVFGNIPEGLWNRVSDIEDYYGWESFVATLTLEEIEALANGLATPFYSVYEVEVADG